MFMIYYASSGTSNLTGTSVHYNRRYVITSNMDIAMLIATTTRNIKLPKLEKIVSNEILFTVHCGYNGKCV